MLSADELARWLRDMLGVLPPGRRARAAPAVLSGLPEQVLKASKAELYLTAVMHYLTLACRRTSMPARHCSRASSCPGSSNWAASLNSSRCWRRWSRRAPRCPRWTPPMLPGSSGNTAAMSSACCPGRAIREIRALVGGALVQHVAGDARVDEFLDRNVETATDALRLAVALSGGDVSLTTATTRFAPMKRGVPPAAAPARSRAQRSGRRDAPRRALEAPAEVLHPGDYADKYPRALAAITAARRNDAPASFVARRDAAGPTAHRRAHAPAATTSRRIRAPAGCDLAPLDRTRRRAGRIRNGGGASVHADPAAGAGPGPGAAPPPGPSRPRAHWPRSTASRIAVSRWRPKRARPGSAGRARQALRLCRRWAAASSTPLRDIVPLAQRAASKSLRTLVRGSRLPLPDTRFIRLFLWWKNGRARTDIDLSAAFFDANFVFMQTVAYYNLKGFGGYHSGDIVDAPQRLGVHRPGHRRPRRERHPLRRHVDQLLHPAAVLRPARVLRRLDGPRRSGLGRSVRATHGGRPDRHRVGHADLPALRDGSAGTPRDLGRPGADVHAALEQCAEQSERGVLDAAGIGAYAPAGSGDAV